MQDMRAILVLLAALPLSAQPNQDRLTVTGDAEIKVAPDRVVIHVGVESRNPQLSTAKTHNDTAIAAILAAAKNEQVAAADVQTDFIEITPVYQNRTSTENREAYVIDFYRVNKTAAITLREVARFERLLTAVINAGANRVYGVNFQTSELRKHRDHAREMAVKAAIEKAQAMAAAAGLRVDKPESISAYNQAGPIYARAMSNVAQNASFATANDLESGGTIAPGRITVSAAVTLTFRLLP